MNDWIFDLFAWKTLGECITQNTSESIVSLRHHLTLEWSENLCLVNLFLTFQFEPRSVLFQAKVGGIFLWATYMTVFSL